MRQSITSNLPWSPLLSDSYWPMSLPLPKWLDSAFRVEYYIKTGIVLLGATFPITLIVTAGPIALLQATIISVTTCLVIYFVATKYFGLDKRLASVIGVGGAVCGVSASMAIAASVKAKKEYLYTSVTLVVVWALVMIIVLPFVSKLLSLAPGVAGAWIGTSEFADAAGFAAASAYGKMAGNEAAAMQGFTLMKVIGRDMWIGIWSFFFAMIACLKWEKEECGVRPSAMEIWWRFPKFVIGFFLATIPDDHVHRRLLHRDFQQHGQTQPDYAAGLYPFLDLYLLLPEHRSEHPLPGAQGRRLETFRGLYHRGGGQRAPRFYPVGLCVWLILVGVG